MKSCKYKTGLTLIEILVVAAVIAILITIVIGIAARINTQSREQLTKNSFALLDAALSQFSDYGYNYSDPCLANLKFPLDCNGFTDTDLKKALEAAQGVTNANLTGSGIHEPSYSGSEALYFFLSRVPESKKTLDKIDKSLITDEDTDGDNIIITIDGKKYPLLRVIDPWGIILRYSYYENKREKIGPPTSEPGQSSPRVFPVITSAGPDKEFNTADDIRSR